MKKFFSLLCMFALVMSASAELSFVKKETRNLPKVEVNKKQLRHESNPAAKAIKAPARANDAVLAPGYVEMAYYPTYGDYTVYFCEDDVDFNLVACLDFFTTDETHIAGNYRTDYNDFDLTYCYVINPDDATDTLEVDAAELTITYVSTTAGAPEYRYEAYITAADGNVYSFDVTLSPDAYNYQNYYYCVNYGFYCDEVDIELEDAPFVVTGDTIRLTLEEAEVDDSYYDSYGDIAFTALNADQTTGTLLDMFVDPNALAGNYVQADFDMSYTQLLVDGAMLKIKDVSAVITFSGTTGTIVATLLASDGNVYVLTFPFTYDPANAGGGGSTSDGLQYDTQDRGFTETFNTVELDDSDYAQYGSYYIIASKGEDAQLVLDMTLPESGIDPTIVIPAGVYNLEGTYAPGTATASQGYIAAYDYISPCYAATLIDQNGTLYLNDIWFMVAGTITVSNNNGNLHMVIAATNSYNQPINITIDAPVATAVENVETLVETSARKFFRDGQIVIEKNGVEYNTLGTVVK